MSMTNQTAWNPSPKLKNRQIESMFKFTDGPFTVRVWLEASSVEQAMYPSVSSPPAGLSMGRLAEWVAGQPHVAAVEVLDESGNGVIIYPDWK